PRACAFVPTAAYVFDQMNTAMRVFDVASQLWSTIAAYPSAPELGGPNVPYIRAIALTPDGTELWFTDENNNEIGAVGTVSQSVRRIAGNGMGSPDYVNGIGVGGADNAAFAQPTAIVAYAAGGVASQARMYVLDTCRIRALTLSTPSVVTAVFDSPG